MSELAETAPVVFAGGAQVSCCGRDPMPWRRSRVYGTTKARVYSACCPDCLTVYVHEEARSAYGVLVGERKAR